MLHTPRLRYSLSALNFAQTKNPRSKHGEGGFTVIEMIVACIVAGLLLIGIMTFLVNSLVNNSVRQARADLIREAQLALDLAAKDIRLSAAAGENNVVEDPHSPNAGSTNGLGWESDSDTLVLATAVEDDEGNILFEDATHYITEKNNIVYYVQDGSLYKRTIANDIENNKARTTCPKASATSTCLADPELAKNVSSLTVRYYDALDNEIDPASARSIGITLTLQARKYNRVVNATYETRMVFRNE